MKGYLISRSRSPSSSTREGEGNRREGSRHSVSRGAGLKNQPTGSPSRGATRVDALSVEAQADASAKLAQQEADLLASALLRVRDCSLLNDALTICGSLYRSEEKFILDMRGF
jgi:hypothetical protein